MQNTITFDQIEAIAAAHYAAEAGRNAPVAVARRAVFALTSALAELSDGDHFAILELLRAELSLDGPALVDTGWRLLGCPHPISCCNTDVCGADPS